MSKREYASFTALVEGEGIKSMPHDGNLREGGGRIVYFWYEGRRWRMNADSKVERVMKVYECLKGGENPFVETTTVRRENPCLDLIARLKTGFQTKDFYVYEAP